MFNVSCRIQYGKNYGCVFGSVVDLKYISRFCLAKFKRKFMTNDVKEQIKEFSNLIEKYPAVQEFYVYRSFLYEKTKQYQKAIEDYKKIIPPQYLNFDIVGICEQHGLIKEAERFYTQAINKDKKNIYHYIRRIHFYMRIKEIDKAILDCKTVLEISPKKETIQTLKRILTEKI